MISEAILFGSLLFVALPANLFPVMYHVMAKWWTTPYGQNLMMLTIAVAGLVDLILIFRILDQPPWVSAVVALLIFGYTGAVMWHRIYLLIQTQTRTPGYSRDEKPE